MMEEESSSQQIQAHDQGNVCPFCKETVRMEEHISNCPAISPDHIHLKPTFIRIDGYGCLCRHCWTLFTEQQWVFHRKSQACHQSSTTSRANSDNKRGRSLPQRAPSSIIKPSINKLASEGNTGPLNIREQSEVIGQGSGLVTDMMRIAQSILAPLIKEWVGLHQQIRPNVLVVYLTSQVVNFGSNFLRKQILVPTWSLIEKKGGQSINWSSFLELPQNLFNDAFINQKLQKITSVRKQLRIVRGLNRLATAFPGLIKKREPPKVNRQRREKSSVRLGDIMLLIRRLLQCRKKKAVHLGLDLYIILLCSQRYLADRQEIKRGVIGLIERNQTRNQDDLILTFSMEIGKTKYKQEVVLNSQLVLMLREFGWQGWHAKTERIVKRMKEWLGIYGYSFKGVIMEAVTEFGSNLTIAQRLAGHRSIRNTEIYTPGTKFRDILRIINSLSVPGLDIRFGRYQEVSVRQSLKNLTVQHMRYEQFKEDWFPALMRRLYGVNFQSHFSRDEDVDFMPALPDSEAVVVPIERQPVIEEAAEMLEEDSGAVLGNIDDILQELQKKTVIVYGVEVNFTGERFHQEDFFEQVIGYEQILCIVCPNPIKHGQTRLRCVFCEGNHHYACAPVICSCTTNKLPLEIPLLPEAALVADPSNEVKMPPSYISGRLKPEEQKMKILLAIRRFRYTRVAVLSPGYPIRLPNNYWRGVKKLILPNFHEYIAGNYFPPIAIKPVPDIENNKFWGVEWGIYATENIGAKVLIGEYACDVIQGSDLILCKKGDSIYRHSGGSTPQDTFLAPKDFSGYVPLVNTAAKRHCNCITMRVILDGCLRVLLVSSNPIRKGEQLCYDYGGTYKFKTKTVAR